MRTNEDVAEGTPWRLEGAKRGTPSVTLDWEPAGTNVIDGVCVRPVRHVLTDNGSLVEMFRTDWLLPGAGLSQVFERTLVPRSISAWHMHEQTTDRLFVSAGLVRLALYDARPDSPTHGAVQELRLGPLRPALVVIPPKVWHGVENLDAAACRVVNLPDRAYQYDAPDDWRLPWDTDQIPFTFVRR